MDKETLSNYGWIVICVLVLAVMIALATPFGNFIADAVKATTQGLFDVNQNALNSTGLINIDHQEFESCDHDYEVTTTANCTTAGTTTHTCKLCGKSYNEETPASHTFDNASDMSCNVCNTYFTAYTFKASDYDAKMGTTIASDENVVIPETFEYNGTYYKTTSLDVYAFSGCSNLKNITLPESIRSFHNYSFDGCNNLDNVSIDSRNTVFHVSGNCIIETATKTLRVGCNNSVIPSDGSVTSIGHHAFYKRINLTSINIPKEVTSIGNNAFYGCTALSSINISEGVTDIGDSAFSDCESLESINIPEGVIKLNMFIFLDCTSLKSITIPTSVTNIGSNIIDSDCRNLTSLTYKGTMDQWNAITKKDGWNISSYLDKVVCTDGTVSLS